jgi:2-C-methyl-D-erythritol 4-phosphate cytidylyltransferase
VELSGVVPLPISVADTRAAFAPLNTAPPLVRVVAALLAAVAEPKRVVVAAAESLVGDVRDALASDGLASVSVVAVGGAATRADCLRAGAEYLREAAFSTSHVLVHDVSRPLASVELATRVSAAMRDGGTVVMPILAVTDSVKAVDARGAITATVDRSQLRAVQFPRGYSLAALSEMLAQHSSGDFDEVAAAIGLAGPVTVVEGEPDAFRTELPGDAEFVEAIIASRAQDPHGA